MGLVSAYKGAPTPIPHEPGEHMTFGMLSGVQLDEARQAKVNASMAQIRAMAGIQLPKSEPSDKAEKDEPNPLAGYDRWVLVRYGIAAWSYGKPVSEEAIEELDDVTATWAATQILAVSIPTKATEKKDSSRSTDTSTAKAA